MKQLLMILVCVAVFGAPVAGRSDTTYGYKGWVPGETMKDEWFTQSRAKDNYFVSCDNGYKGIFLCLNQVEHADYTFVDGTLARIYASIPLGNEVSADVIHQQLVEKYGKPTTTESRPYQNSYGANLQSKRYEWDSPTQRMSFDEIGEDVDHSLLQIIDRKLSAEVTSRKVESQI